MRLKRRVKWALGSLIALGLLWSVGQLLPRDPLLQGLPRSTEITDREGSLLRLTLASDEHYRLITPLSQVAPEMVQATLLYEDRAFFWHPGVNPWALLKAASHTYLQGGKRRGASTLSMQVVRLRGDFSTRSASGKIRQILEAVAMEWRYPKAEILEAYLNLAPYGGNIEGVGAASRIYFDKDAKDLTPLQALTLAVVPQSPNQHRPDRVDWGAPNHPLIQRRAILAERWSRTHNAHSELQTLLDLPLQARSPDGLPFLAPHFVDNVMAKKPTAKSVRTTLDSALQEVMEDRLAAYVKGRRPDGIENAAAILVDVRDMGVRALVGSEDFHNPFIHGQVNGAAAKRSPGSTLKPFIYALAMDQGLIHPQSLVKDAPSRFGPYNPENFDGRFDGPLFATQALIRSRNVPAVELASQLRGPDLYGLLKLSGISELRGRDHYGLSLVLGGAELTLEELASLYAMLANGGQMQSLQKELDAGRPPPQRLLSPEASYLTLNMLRKAHRPAESRLSPFSADDLEVAFKTGTSFAFRDAWTLGTFGPYVLGVWVGNFDGRGDPALVGIKAATPLFFQLVDAVRAQSPDLDDVTAQWNSDLNVEPISVCAISGQIPGPHCTHQKKTLFIPGTSPITTCEVHREIAVDTKTGKRACEFHGDVTMEVFEVWPTDLLRIFERAGIPRRVPPAFDAACGKMNARGRPPVIQSPAKSVTYHLPIGKIGVQQLPLLAEADGDVQAVHWFADEEYLGKVQAGASLFWRPRPGAYVLRAVDDRGRTASRNVEIALLGTP